MPVWHELTREAREAGRLRVVGITQELHPERCRLFAQWKGIDWPILWDPFNLTGAKVVPIATLVDEHGVVRVSRAGFDDLEGFLEATWEAPPDLPSAPEGPKDRLVEAFGAGGASRSWSALSDLLWHRARDPSPAVEALAEVFHAAPAFGAVGEDNADEAFRLGVAYLLRHDSEGRRPGDFTRARGLWVKAFQARPDQYIWRRRNEQYGLSSVQPYPFYAWVETARAELRARGEEPVALPVEPTDAERAGREDR